MVDLDNLPEWTHGALLADGFEGALVTFKRRRGHPVAVYDFCKCVEILMDQDMDYDEAIEWMHYNVLGAYMGPSTPVFIRVDEA